MKFILFFLFSTLFSYHSYASPSAKITFIRGQVLVNSKLASISHVLSVGDIIEARSLPKKKASFVRITFGNGDKIGLSNSKMKIEKLTSDTSLFNLIQGKLFNYAVPKLKRKVFIRSNGISLGVRGTKYMIDAQEKEHYVCVCTGEVSVNAGQSKQIIKSGHDLHAFMGKPLKKPVLASKAMMEMVGERFKLLGEPL